MGFTRTEARKRLSCPHRSDCDYYDIRYDTQSATAVGKLTLTVECISCNGRDHLMYDIESETGHVVEEGERLTLTESLMPLRRQSGGEEAVVTAVAPVHSDVKVGLSWKLGNGRRGGGLVKLSRVEQWLDEGAVTRADQD